MNPDGTPGNLEPPRQTLAPAVLGQEWRGPVEVRVHRAGGESVAYFVPAQAGRRRATYTAEQARLLNRLQLLQSRAYEVEQDIGQAVRLGRELGLSWAVLGFSVGLTDNGARSRHGEPVSVPGEVV